MFRLFPFHFLLSPLLACSSDDEPDPMGYGCPGKYGDIAHPYPSQDCQKVIGYSYQDTHLSTAASQGYGFDVTWVRSPPPFFFELPLTFPYVLEQRRFVLVTIGVTAAGYDVSLTFNFLVMSACIASSRSFLRRQQFVCINERHWPPLLRRSVPSIVP